MAAFPSMRHVASGVADNHALGFPWQAFALAVLGGMLITVMTSMQLATESDGVRLAPAVIVGVIPSIGHVNHAVVASLACFAALVAGASFGYADWLDMLGLAIDGSVVGGLSLVTLLRLLQLPHEVIEVRDDCVRGAALP